MFCPIIIAAMYVLTGASSVGKTTIIKELEQREELVIHEAATDWITSRISEGVTEFWKEEHLGYNILKLQLEREKEFIGNSRRVFVDRGIFDNHAYAMHYHLAGTETLSLINKALDGIDLNKRYSAIFFIEPYKDDFIPTDTEVRKDTLKIVGELQTALYAIYSRHKYFFVIPGNLSPAQRADIILNHLSSIEGSVSELAHPIDNNS